MNVDEGQMKVAKGEGRVREEEGKLNVEEGGGRVRVEET